MSTINQQEKNRILFAHSYQDGSSFFFLYPLSCDSNLGSCTDCDWSNRGRRNERWLVFTILGSGAASDWSILGRIFGGDRQRDWLWHDGFARLTGDRECQVTCELHKKHLRVKTQVKSTNLFMYIMHFVIVPQTNARRPARVQRTKEKWV